MSPAVQSSINLLTKSIVKACRPQKVILFGSYAWGRPGTESDVDLLVIKKSRKPRYERESDIRAKLFPPPTPFDVLVYTPDELKRNVEQDRNLFLEDILKNGIVLYDTNNKIRP